MTYTPQSSVGLGLRLVGERSFDSRGGDGSLFDSLRQEGGGDRDLERDLDLDVLLKNLEGGGGERDLERVLERLLLLGGERAGEGEGDLDKERDLDLLDDYHKMHMYRNRMDYFRATYVILNGFKRDTNQIYHALRGSR